MNDLKPLQTEKLPNTNISRESVSSNNPVAVYLLIRFASFLFFIIASIFIRSIGIYFVVVSIMECFQFWFIKNVSGLHLVGLKWMITMPKENGEFFQYFSRPPPYIPISYQTNVFWFGCFFSIIFYVCAFIICIIARRILRSFAPFGILCAEIFNLVLFAQAHSCSKLATENDALTKLLDNPIALAQMEINSTPDPEIYKDTENPENSEEANNNEAAKDDAMENDTTKQDDN